jgi:hypothetical protein
MIKIKILRRNRDTKNPTESADDHHQEKTRAELSLSPKMLECYAGVKHGKMAIPSG